MIFGVDPGLKGGVAGIKNGELIHLLPMPKFLFLLTRELNSFSNFKIVVEHQAPRPFQHIGATHSQAYGYGKLVGAFLALGWPVYTVTPQAWQKELFALAGVTEMVRRKKDDKARSIAAARLFFPRADFVGKGKRTAQDGLCDAALIALWASRNLGSLTPVME